MPAMIADELLCRMAADDVSLPLIWLQSDENGIVVPQGKISPLMRLPVPKFGGAMIRRGDRRNRPYCGGFEWQQPGSPASAAAFQLTDEVT